MTDRAELKTWYGLIATVGTLGTYTSMPGTLGSVAAFVILLLARGIPLWAIAAAALVGGYAADRYAKAVGREDPQEVVIDEVVGYWVSCIGFDLTYAMAALFFFRIVDITKPIPIRQTERLPGGVGIMADDIVGGLMVNLLMRGIQWLFFKGGLEMLRGGLW